MNASEWSSTRVRVPASTSRVRRSIDIPVMNERYEGKSGRTQGDRNENNPAENATSTVSELATALPEDGLEERLSGGAAPFARAVGDERAMPVAIDDERRRHGPHPVEPGDG